MGKGKTTSAINYINKSNDDERFIFITPYLKEVKRIKDSCPTKNFKEPCSLNGRKLDGIKELIANGNNIVSTHALFQKFDLELIHLFGVQNYTLIMDEVANVIEQYDISNNDYDILKEKFIDIDTKTGLLLWRNSDKSYCGKFEEERRLCELKGLAHYGGSKLMQMFPIEIFNAFKNIYILTYMFEAQIQRCYFDYYKLPYTYLYVTATNEFTSNPQKRAENTYDYHDLIHILEDKKLNCIGEKEYDLSKSWYKKNADSPLIKQLRNNIVNFYINRRKTKTRYNLWTTFKDYKALLSGKGYSRGYVPLNMRASNEYALKTSVVYPVNRYFNPGIKNFFSMHGIDVDEDGFALSEMLQFIWRSAIRDGKEIWIYIPSKKMRNLLKTWIDEKNLEK